MHALVLALALAIGAAAQTPSPKPPAVPPTGTVAAAPETSVTTTSGLVYTIVAAGTGPITKAGQTVRIHETLTLPDGRLIFTSTGKAPVKFLLGGNQVIPGVDEGVTGMRVGERRKLVVRPALDGRTFDPAFIPPDVNRHYDIELVEIVKDGQP